MTSQGTHNQYVECQGMLANRILSELESHDFFGLDKENITLMRQAEVPSIVDMKGTLALKPDGHLLLKPHGHGDIHTLLYQVANVVEALI